MGSMELYENIKRCADREIARGVNPEQIEALAKDQEREGVSVSAIYTRLLASTMRATLAESRP